MTYLLHQFTALIVAAGYGFIVGAALHLGRPEVWRGRSE